MSELSTESLFHYTRRDKLISILEGRCFKPSFVLEEIDMESGVLKEVRTFLEEQKGKSSSDEVFEKLQLALPMCCFCDIPLDKVSNHTQLYGSYSIGLKRAWVEENGISPVIYLSDRSEIKTVFNHLLCSYKRDYKRLRELKEEVGCKQKTLLFNVLITYDFILDLLMYIKPFTGRYEKNERTYDKYRFYNEREWRYKPSKYHLDKNVLTKEEFDNKSILKYNNKKLKPIKFDFKDIDCILVPENELEEFKSIVGQFFEGENTSGVIKCID